MEIHPLELKELIEAGKNLFLLDVRTEHEAEICFIEGSHLIPVHELQGRVNEVPRDKKIITICHHGNRSWMAMQFLLNEGYSDVLNLAGGVEGWAANVDPTMARY